MSAVDVLTEIQIDRSVEEVSRFASNPDNATKWYANIKSVEWKTAKPVMEGSRLEFTAEFLGKKLVYTYEVVEYVLNEKFVMRTASGPFPMETIYYWERISKNETRMKLRNHGTPSGFSRIFGPIMAMAIRRANKKDLKRLKKIIEKK
jgi:hypothetical protein